MSNHRQSPDDVTRTMTGNEAVLAAGTVLNQRYEIKELAGVGGMGVVYRAHDRQLDIDVALKLLRTGAGADDQALARFRDEILLARQVSHPNVVRIHDIGQDGDVIYLTMDYVEARTLRDRLTEEGALDSRTAVAIALQLAGALSAAHQEGVIHRDIKPGNILVDDRGHAWLMDFGIARSMGKQGLTRQGEIVGTIQYLAPEQVRGDDIDNRTDLYALGLVLWEMLTGQVILAGETDEETLARHATGRLPATLPGDNKVPPKLRAIVRRCLAARPEERYQDARELVADLQRGRARFDRRRLLRRASGAAAAMVVLVALAAGLWWWRDTADTGPAGAGPERVQRLAVFPIVNATDSASLDWVRRGLAESIANDLAENQAIRVTEPLRIIRALADLRLDPDMLGDDRLRELGELFAADTVVTGQLLGSGPDYQLQLRLLERATGKATRLQTDVGQEGVLAGAAQLVRQIMDTLEVEQQAQVATVPMSANQEALAAYDSGIASLAIGDHAGAAGAFEQAVALDRNFGAAWLHLASAYQSSGRYDQAIDASSQAVELLGGSGGHLELQARIRQAALAGDMGRAVELAREMVRRYPEQARAKLTLGEMLGETGRLDEAREVLQEVVGIDPSHVQAWFLLGKYAIMAGDPAAAVNEYLVRALVLLNRMDNPFGQGEVLNALGIAHERMGELGVAGDYYRQALERRRLAGDRRGLSATMSNLARLNMIQGDYDRARESLQQALSLREELGDLAGMAAMHNEIGLLEEEIGRYNAAMNQYRNALRIYEEIGDRMGVTDAQTNLAFIYLMLGRYDNADVFIEHALAEHRAAGNDHGLMSALQINGELQLARGRWEQARSSLLEALELARKIDNPSGRASVQGSIATLAWHQGRIGAALASFGMAIELLEPLADNRGLAEYHLRSAEMLADLRLTEAAGEKLQQARDRFGDTGNLSQQLRLQLVSAALASQRGNPDEARDLLDTAAELGEETGSELFRFRIALARGMWLETSVEQARELTAAAAAIGHRHYRLVCLNLLASEQLQAGQAEAALESLRVARRPTVALDPWVGLWRQQALNARALQAAGQPGWEPLLEEARSRFDALVSDLPEALQGAMTQPPELLGDTSVSTTDPAVTLWETAEFPGRQLWTVD